LSGLAASLAAKTLLTNVIAGTEMLLDDAAAPGECVSAAGVTGVVRESGLRTLVLETPGGALHRIPNSAITVLANHSRRPNQVVLEIELGYQEDPSGLVDAINAEATAMVLDESLSPLVPGDTILELGVQRLEHDTVTARVQMCAPLRGGELARLFRDRFGERVAGSGLAVGPPFGVTHLPATEFQAP
jgi:small-conductance mechanosensitive channel